MRLTARNRTAVVFLAAAFAAWVVTIHRMRGMDEGPGTSLGGLGWYLGVWVTMTAAMMLPTALPAARSAAGRGLRAPVLLFAAGYLGVWTAYGLVAYGLYRLVGAGGILHGRDCVVCSGALMAVLFVLG